MEASKELPWLYAINFRNSLYTESTTASASRLVRIIFRTSGVLPNQQFASTTRSISRLSHCRKLASTLDQFLEIHRFGTFLNGSMTRRSATPTSSLSSADNY